MVGGITLNHLEAVVQSFLVRKIRGKIGSNFLGEECTMYLLLQSIDFAHTEMLSRCSLKT